MDNKTINKNLKINIFMCLLCVVMFILALIMRQSTMAVILALLSFVQAMFAWQWIARRKRNERKNRFMHKHFIQKDATRDENAE